MDERRRVRTVYIGGWVADGGWIGGASMGMPQNLRSGAPDGN
jgi:hypothetical protein